MINGKHANANETTFKLALADKHPYLLQVKVTLAGDQVTIAAALDSQPVGQVVRPAECASPLTPYYACPQPKCIGLAADSNTALVYTSARLRMITGKAVPLEKYEAGGAAPASTATAPTKPRPKVGIRPIATDIAQP